jgi:hypothetical protein
MKRTGATRKGWNLIGSAVCIFFLAGCSNVPVVKKHNISEIGASSVLKIRPRKPLFLGYIKTYDVAISISKEANRAWYDACRETNWDGVCKLPGTRRVQVTNDTTNELVTSTISQGIKNGDRGDEVFFSLLRIDLDPGDYTVTVENLSYEAKIPDPSGNVEVDFGAK